MPGGDSLFLGKQSQPGKGKIVMTNGISFHFFPSPEDETSYQLVGYADTWEGGLAMRTEMFLREPISLHANEFSDFTHFEFGLFIAEIASAILESRTSLQDLVKFSETVARIVRASETLSNEE